MKLYFSLPISNNVWLVKVIAELHNSGYEINLMLSYWYHKEIALYDTVEKYFNKPYPNIIIDSGAYTAKTKDKIILINDYKEWLLKNDIKKYINLDVIGDEKATYKNQLNMEKDKFLPIPVFHYGENSYYLNKYLDMGYSTIGLGGLVGGTKTKNKVFLDKCFSLAKNDPIFHGFGIGSWDIIQSYNWQSVDSSSYGASFRFGNCVKFQEGQFIKIDKKDMDNSDMARGSFIAWIDAFDWINKRTNTPVITNYQLGFDI